MSTIVFETKEGYTGFPQWWASLTLDHLEYGWTRNIKRILNKHRTVIIDVEFSISYIYIYMDNGPPA